MKVLMTGNEAVARGAYEAGVTVASAYPGTPSTDFYRQGHCQNRSVPGGCGPVLAISDWRTSEKRKHRTLEVCQHLQIHRDDRPVGGDPEGRGP